MFKHRSTEQLIVAGRAMVDLPSENADELARELALRAAQGDLQAAKFLTELTEGVR
jgi:hypothetical protein